jgi:hypothetical protein
VAISPPYPADVRTKGWRFEVDLERIRESDTWTLATPDLRPWLLMLWNTAWVQTPAGSFPNDDAMISARIGMDPRAFKAARPILMRRWELATDGRLYHPVITEQVLALIALRQAQADRKAAYRANQRKVPEESHGTDSAVPRPSHGTDNREGKGREGKGVKEKEHLSTGALSPTDVADPADPADFKLNGTPTAIPDCPHEDIRALWAEVMPELPQPAAWRGQRVEHLRTRWREVATEKHWTTQKQGIAYFRKLFRYVRQSPFLLGKKPGRDNRAFVVELPWLIRPENFLKVIEGKYHEETTP